MSFMYLAQPYSHPELAVRVERFIEARKFLVWAFQERFPVFSPIVHWHQIAIQYELPYDAKAYQAQNTGMLTKASTIGILTIPGWRESIGLRQELESAAFQGLPCFCVSPISGDYLLIEEKNWTPATVLAK